MKSFHKNLKPFKAFESTHAEESTFQDIVDEEEAAAEVEELPDDRACSEQSEAEFHESVSINHRKSFIFFKYTKIETQIEFGTDLNPYLEVTPIPVWSP